MIGMELAWHKINVPDKFGQYRHTCPWCSETRKKHQEKCLVVNIFSNVLAKVFCHHCKVEKEIAA